MKFSCDQMLLSRSINIVSKAISSRTTIPILKGILLEVKEDKLTLYASDLDLTIEHIMNVKVEEEGSVVVLADLFLEIIRKLPAGEITIEKIEGNTLFIKNGYSESNLTGVSPDEFPKNLDYDENGEELFLNKEIFSEMVKKTSFAASNDESKGIITGVLVEVEEDSLNMAALDGFRMAVAKEDVINTKKNSLIIPAKLLNEVNKILFESKEENIYIKLNDKKAIFKLKDTTMMLRLLEGKFIKYKDLLPKESSCKVIVNKEEIRQSIERAALLAREGKNNLIKWSLKENLLTITSRSEEGKIKEEVNIEKEGIDLDIGFNSKYLMEVLSKIEDEEIKIELNSPISPCIVKPIQGESYCYLILPVRISGQ